MTEKLEQQIRYTLEQADAAAPPHDLLTSAQVWLRLQFRLGHRPRRDSYASHSGPLFAALYVLGFVMWMTWSEWFSASVIAVLGFAAAAAGLFCLHVSRKFRS
jgi:hypothetical protein